MNSWQVGNIKITRVVEMQVTGGSRFQWGQTLCTRGITADAVMCIQLI